MTSKRKYGEQIEAYRASNANLNMTRKHEQAWHANNASQENISMASQHKHTKQ